MAIGEEAVRRVLEYLPVFVLAIQGTGPLPDGSRRVVYIIIRQRFAYLEEALRRAFAAERDVQVIVDRRRGERRTSSQPVASTRRGERRRPQREVGEVVIAEAPTP